MLKYLAFEELLPYMYIQNIHAKGNFRGSGDIVQQGKEHMSVSSNAMWSCSLAESSIKGYEKRSDE